MYITRMTEGHKKKVEANKEKTAQMNGEEEVVEEPAESRTQYHPGF